MKESKQMERNQGQAYQKNGTEIKELDMDKLNQVTGGLSLRDIDKTDTTDISDDTKSKV